MQITRSPSLRLARSARVVASAVVIAGMMTACVPSTSDGGQVITTTDDRIFQIRTARVALAEPVPVVVAEVDRLVAAIETVWITGDDTHARANLAATLDPAPLRIALASLVAAGPVGDGPDMIAARSVIGEIAAHIDQVAVAARGELDEFEALRVFDDQLAQVLVGWGAPGSRRTQLEAFAQLAEQATALSVDLAAQTETVGCTQVYARRSGVAELLAERTRSLRALVEARQGADFDELRREFSEDPFGFGTSLGEADRTAAARCWRQQSPVATAPGELARLVDELAATLDPAELQG
jgi:hypothetical protein